MTIEEQRILEDALKETTTRVDIELEGYVEKLCDHYGPDWPVKAAMAELEEYLHLKKHRRALDRTRMAFEKDCRFLKDIVSGRQAGRKRA